MITLPFPHIIGNHCSSTSLADIARYDGCLLSEALAFGIGAGLGFFYVDDDGSPTHRFNGRAPQLEANFYRHTGQPLAWERRWDFDHLTAALAAGRPVIAVTDIFYLPYYQPPVHFAGHGVVVVGVDPARQTVDIADIASPQPITVPAEVLKNAMAEPNPPLLEPFCWAAAPDSKMLTIDRDAIVAGLQQTGRQMLQVEDETVGFKGMNRLIQEFPTWGNATDWRWAARFGYQGIEKRGTGGGGFRKMYADFLAEAAEYLPELHALNAEAQMRLSGEKWTTLANCLKQIFIAEDPAGFNDCAALLAEIVAIERPLMENFLHSFSRLEGRNLV